MSETPQQYTQRLLNNLGEQNPIDVLESTISRIDALARALEKKGLQNKPAPNKWTAAQILSHLAEGEIVFSYRLRKTLNDSGTAIEAFDQ
ncbi:MAG TPA: DinB family protein [Acidobacteriota bacterium]|nr:DinB family protein [Acidobacteriota bacterium]